MYQLTDYGHGVVSDLSSRYGLSRDAVCHMIQAVINGGGTMAQFQVPELGGSGQWMMGGMTMVGDMFNNGLQATVSNLCTEISNMLASGQGVVFQQNTPTGNGMSGNGMVNNGNWWPEDLGMPSSSGAQNNQRYAIFPHCARLAVDNNGQMSVYNTLDHQIGGVGQQQGASGSLTFTSQYGPVFLEQLPLVSGPGTQQGGYQSDMQQGYAPQSSEPVAMNQPDSSPVNTAGHTVASDDIFTLIERLASLRDNGVLSEDEFASKKSELLQRI